MRWHRPPRETAEQAKARVGKEYDVARKEYNKKAEGLVRAEKGMERARTQLEEARADIKKAHGRHGELEEEMRRLWGDGADERMDEPRAVELEQLAAQGEAGEFSTVLGRDPGEDMWVPEHKEGGGEDEDMDKVDPGQRTPIDEEVMRNTWDVADGTEAMRTVWDGADKEHEEEAAAKWGEEVDEDENEEDLHTRAEKEAGKGAGAVGKGKVEGRNGKVNSTIAKDTSKK